MTEPNLSTDGTGATPAQIESAAARFALWPWTPDSIASQVQFWAAKLIPPGSVLLEPDDLAVLRRVRNLYAAALGFGYPLTSDEHHNDADFERLNALVERDR